MDYGIIKIADNGELTIESGDTPKRVSGLSALVQEVLIELLSDPIPAQSRGAGLASILLTAPLGDDSVTSSSIASAVSVAQSHIFTNQQFATNLQPEGRLRKLELLRASRLPNGWRVDVQVTNQAGEVVSFTVPTS